MAYNFAPYRSATHCAGRAQPGMVYLAAFITKHFPKTKTWNIYSCRPVYGGSGYSHHAEGRADDQFVPTTSSGRAIPSIGMPVIEMLGPHGRELGIDHMIYNREIWSASAPSGRYYSGKHPHYDHWHIGLTRTAAESLTLTKINQIVFGTSPPPSPQPEPVPAGEIMLPLEKDQQSEDVRMLKDRMNETFAGTTNSKGVAYKTLEIGSDGGDIYGEGTVNRVRDFLGSQYSGHPGAATGVWVGANQWNALEIMWIKRKLGL